MVDAIEAHPPSCVVGPCIGAAVMSASARDDRGSRPTDDPFIRPDAALAADARVAEVTDLRIAGHRCTVLCVDNVIPRHSAARRGGHPRLTYVDSEVVHFELDGHLYALVSEDAPASPPPAPGRDPTVVPDDIHKLLTNRELQIVQLICMGCLTKQAADRLHISEYTVRSYLKTIYCKLGVRSRGAMVYRYAQAFNRSTAER